MYLSFDWQFFPLLGEWSWGKSEWQEVTETLKGIWQENVLPSCFVSSLNTWITVFAKKSVCTDEWELEFIPMHLQKPFVPALQGRTQGRFLELRLSCTQASRFLTSQVTWKASSLWSISAWYKKASKTINAWRTSTLHGASNSMHLFPTSFCTCFPSTALVPSQRLLIVHKGRLTA